MTTTLRRMLRQMQRLPWVCERLRKRHERSQTALMAQFELLLAREQELGALEHQCSYDAHLGGPSYDPESYKALVALKRAIVDHAAAEAELQAARVLIAHVKAQLWALGGSRQH